MRYVWENAETEDYEAGLLALLFSCIVGALLVLVTVMFSAESSASASAGDTVAGGASRAGKASTRR
jgi:hypothetical protein